MTAGPLSFEEFKRQKAQGASDFELAKQYLDLFKDDPALQATLELMLIGKIAGAPVEPERVIMLVHGIRTTANWQQLVEQELGLLAPNVTVYPVRYGVFDLISFLSPVGTRGAPVKRVLQEIQDAKLKHPNAKISVVAHSFGTYVMSKILKHHDVSLERLVLCGAVIPEDYRWRDVREKIEGPVVNDVGTQDILPLVAKHATVGYGPSGRYGFGTVHVKDRFFDFGHSGFFTEHHIRTFWAPLLLRGQVVPSGWGAKRKAANPVETAIAGLPVKWIVLCSLALYLLPMRKVVAAVSAMLFS